MNPKTKQENARAKISTEDMIYDPVQSTECHIHNCIMLQ